MLRFLKQQFWLESSDRNIIMALAAGFGLFFELVTVVMTLATPRPSCLPAA